MIGTKIYRLVERMGYNPFDERMKFTDINGKVWIEQRPNSPWVCAVAEYTIVSLIEVKISGANLEQILEMFPFETDECFSSRYILKSEDEDNNCIVLKVEEMKSVLEGNSTEFYLDRNEAEMKSEMINASRE